MSSAASSTPSKTLPSLAQLCRDSLRLYRNNAWLLLGYAGWLLLPLAVHIVIRVTFGNSQNANIADGVVNIVTTILIIALYNIIALSVPVLATAHADAARTQLLDAATERGQQLIFPVFISLFLASIAIFLGLIVIVPGILFATWFAFAGLSTLFGNTRGLSSLVASKHLMKGRFWPVFVRVWGFQLIVAFGYTLVTGIIYLAFGYNPSGADIFALPPLPADILLRVIEIGLLPLAIIYMTLLYLALKNE